MKARSRAITWPAPRSGQAPNSGPRANGRCVWYEDEECAGCRRVPIMCIRSVLIAQYGMFPTYAGWNHDDAAITQSTRHCTPCLVSCTQSWPTTDKPQAFPNSRPLPHHLSRANQRISVFFFFFAGCKLAGSSARLWGPGQAKPKRSTTEKGLASALIACAALPLPTALSLAPLPPPPSPLPSSPVRFHRHDEAAVDTHLWSIKAARSARAVLPHGTATPPRSHSSARVAGMPETGQRERRPE